MSKNKKKKKQPQIGEIRNKLIAIGDQTTADFHKNHDVKVGKLAVQAYGQAINAAKTQVMYKRLTGQPGKMKFLEDPT